MRDREYFLSLKVSLLYQKVYHQLRSKGQYEETNGHRSYV